MQALLARSRKHPGVRVGLSPRAGLALLRAGLDVEHIIGAGIVIEQRDLERLAPGQRARGVALLLLAVPSPSAYVLEHLTAAEKLSLAASPYPSAKALIEDARIAVADAVLARTAPGGVRTPEQFAAARDAFSAAVVDELFQAVSLTARILTGPDHTDAIAPAAGAARAPDPDAAIALAWQHILDNIHVALLMALAIALLAVASAPGAREVRIFTPLAGMVERPELTSPTFPLPGSR